MLRFVPSYGAPIRGGVDSVGSTWWRPSTGPAIQPLPTFDRRNAGGDNGVAGSGSVASAEAAMTRRAMLLAVGLAAALSAAPAPLRSAGTDLPERLTDRDFWRVVETFSEPSGFFNSDNLVSNEDTYQHVIPDLVATVAPGGVYVGVGPEQNFTYIAALNPGIAFILDVRRGNLHLHLMYKALIELSADRAEFLSRLFSRPRPKGLGGQASARELFAAYRGSRPDARLYDANRRAMLAHLTTRRGFVLQPGDREGLEYVLGEFYAGGPGLTFVSNGRGRRATYPTLESLQTATDAEGVARGYLASEAAFRRLKSLQERNLVVPLVGDFAGSKALVSVASFAREHRATVTTFYASNVENYLFQDGLWDTFRGNLARMPLDRTSTFIRSCFGTCSLPGEPRAVSLLDSIPGLLADAALGRVRSYWDVLTHSRLPRPPR